jgi:hypothetical protein
MLRQTAREPAMVAPMPLVHYECPQGWRGLKATGTMSALPALCPVARTTSSGLAGTSGRSSLANFELRGHFHRPCLLYVSTPNSSRRGRYAAKGNPSQGNSPIMAQATSFVPSDLNRKYSTASGMAKTIPSSQEVSDKLDFFYTESGQREWVR